MKDKILTKNPDPTKRGVKVGKERYDFIRGVILSVLKSQGPLSSAALIEAVVDDVEQEGKVDYSVGWYAMALKLDLEARGEILYDRGAKQPVLSLPPNK